MREALMRLVALAALTAAGDMLAPEGRTRDGIRFIGGLLIAGVILDLIMRLDMI